MNPLTPERLEQIEKRCNAALADNWTGRLFTTSQAGIDFIDHSLTDIPDLLSEIKRLRGRGPAYICRDEKCGGCYDCLLMQARYVAEKIEQERDSIRAQLSDAQAALKEKDEALQKDGHSLSNYACAACDDMDGCHYPTAALQLGRE